jgi:CMP/dCMP kinase
VENSLLRIAIDGPSASGKGTISSLLANRLGLLHITSGALFRAMALVGLENGLDLEKVAEDDFLDLLEKTEFEFQPSIKSKTEMIILINGHDRTNSLRSQEVDAVVSEVSRFPRIRSLAEDLLRKFAKRPGIIMDGRDAGTVFMPEADFKFFLTAALESRAQRRLKDYADRGLNVDYQQVLSDIAERDREDRERVRSPFRKAPDAVLIDNTNLSIEATMEKILKIISDEST